MRTITNPPSTHTQAGIKARRALILVADLQQGSNEMTAPPSDCDEGNYAPTVTSQLQRCLERCARLLMPRRANLGTLIDLSLILSRLYSPFPMGPWERCPMIAW